MNNLKIISLLILLNLASFAFAGSATEDGITVIANIVQNSDGTGPVGDTELQTTITAETFASADTTIEVTRPASYSLKANADDTTPSTAQPVNFSMLFAETPELSNKKTTNFAGDTELGVNIAASLLQGTGTVGDTELQTTIAGEIGSGTSDTEKQVTVVANIFQNKNGVGPVGDTELQVTVSGQTSFGTTSASSQGVTLGGYIFQGNADNKPVGDTELQTTITGNIGFGTGDTENGVSVTGLIFQSSSGGDTEPRDTTDFQRTYSWDFDGDGVFDFQSDSSGNAVYAFSEPGNYLAAAKVIASDGTEVYDTILLNVSGPTIIKSCSINSETFNIELGQNAGPVNAAYSSFFSTPTIESVVCASAPSNASLIGLGSCAGGSCSFSCGPYNAEKTEYIAALRLLDMGETVNCSGFAEVVVGSVPAPSCSSLTAVPASGVGSFTSVLTAAFSNSEGLNIDFDCDGDGTAEGQAAVSGGFASYNCVYPVVAVAVIYAASATESGSSASCTTSVTVNPVTVGPSCSSLTAVPASGVGSFTSVLTAAFSNSEGLNIDFDCDGDGTAEGQAAVSGGFASYNCVYPVVAVATTYAASATESGSSASCTTSVTVNPMPAGSGPYLRLTKIDVEPENFSGGAEPDFTVLNVTVKNFGDSTDASIGIKVFGATDFSMADETEFASAQAGCGPDPLGNGIECTKSLETINVLSLVPGSYKLVVKAYANSVEQDSDSVFFIVIGPVPVPELGFVFVPLLAVSALAIMFFAGKSGKAKK